MLKPTVRSRYIVVTVTVAFGLLTTLHLTGCNPGQHTSHSTQVKKAETMSDEVADAYAALSRYERSALYPSGFFIMADLGTGREGNEKIFADYDPALALDYVHLALQGWRRSGAVRLGAYQLQAYIPSPGAKGNLVSVHYLKRDGRLYLSENERVMILCESYLFPSNTCAVRYIAKTGLTLSLYGQVPTDTIISNISTLGSLIDG